MPQTILAFVLAEWGLLHEAAHRAEQTVSKTVSSAPRTACFCAHRNLDLGVTWLYALDRAFKAP